MKTEQAIVELTNDVLGAKEVVESPLFPEGADVCAKDGRGKWPEIAWLVDSNKEILNLQRF